MSDIPSHMTVAVLAGHDGFDQAEDGDATWGGAPLIFPRIQGARNIDSCFSAPDLPGIEVEPDLQILGKAVAVYE